uniref:Uncharacterized protein n=1 Tax=Mycena chlorophos TaxID=658473 RepID=A0ABQ0LIW8_MYCCL|nr:predicted protein [Mycena chlorophos]
MPSSPAFARRQTSAGGLESAHDAAAETSHADTPSMTALKPGQTPKAPLRALPGFPSSCVLYASSLARHSGRGSLGQYSNPPCSDADCVGNDDDADLCMVDCVGSVACRRAPRRHVAGTEDGQYATEELQHGRRIGEPTSKGASVSVPLGMRGKLVLGQRPAELGEAVVDAVAGSISTSSTACPNLSSAFITSLPPGRRLAVIVVGTPSVGNGESPSGAATLYHLTRIPVR